jgi:hypothetical protein
MCQILGWREYCYPSSDFSRVVSKIARHEPCTGGVSQGKEGQVSRVWSGMRPNLGIGETHGLFDQKLQPKRRKPKTAKFRALYDRPVFFDDQRAGDYLHLSVQNPIHDELRRRAFRLYTGGDDYVCIQDSKSHLVFRRFGTLRSCLIS